MEDEITRVECRVNELILSGTVQKGCSIDGSQHSGSGVIIMQRSVSDQTSAPANDIPPPVADHRSRSLVTETEERGRRGAGSGPGLG